MRTNLLPQTISGPSDTPTDPQAVVEAFLGALADKDIDVANALIADDIDYINVGFPAVRGRKDMQKVFDLARREAAGFEVYLHSISADGEVVLTERTDVLIFGPFRMQFWVWGRFDVSDGAITLWRDSFDLVDLVRSAVRGLVALVVPSFQTKPPRTGDAPGR